MSSRYDRSWHYRPTIVGAKTLGIMTLDIMTLDIMTHSIILNEHK